MSDYEIDRVKTGIPGLDELIEGGFPRGDTILVAGKAGTGKTILANQFLYNGAVMYEEPGVLVTLEESPIAIKRNMLRFNMDFEALIIKKQPVNLGSSTIKHNKDSLLYV